MQIVVASDSFKGSLTANQVCRLIAKAAKETSSQFQVSVKPMADGGEGTLDVLIDALKATKISLRITGPLGKTIDAAYGITKERKAIIEVAAIAGLPLVSKEYRNPDIITTYGIGEVIHDALNRGCRQFIIGLGGSASNDGGLGMLMALGLKAWDKRGKNLAIFGKDLLALSSLELTNLDPRLKECQFNIASDVDNPLCGEQGATRVYGPQKGLINEQIPRYEAALNNYKYLLEKGLGKTCSHIPGAGAAGGLGFAFLCLNGEIRSGAQLIAEAIALEERVKSANLVITGEGKSDEQTLFGKCPSYVAKLAKKYQVPCILLSGSVVGEREALRELFTACFSITNEPLTLQECLDRAEQLLFTQAKELFSLVLALV